MRIRFFIVFIFATIFSYAEVADLINLPQDPQFYFENSERVLVSKEISQKKCDEFIAKYFSIWQQAKPKIDKESAFRSLHRFKEKEIYGPSKQKYDKSWLENLEKLSDVNSYPNQCHQGIVTSNTDLRILPTVQPAFYDFSLPGEGYPFDNLQNSYLLAGIPVFISHLSKDGAWVFVEAPFQAAGWVSINAVATVDKKFMSTYQTGHYSALIKDDISINSEDGFFRFKGNVGSFLPVLSHDSKDIKVYIPVSDINRKAILLKGEISKGHASLMPFDATVSNFVSVANEFIGKPYGWGGYLGNRDCSAFIRDFFVPFGIYMPRNSGDQSREGISSIIKDCTLAEKEKKIKKMGVPFLSVIYQRGHVLLYMGEYEGKPVVMHSAWGLKTLLESGEYGREVIGKSVITTLQAGSEMPEVVKDSTYLKKAEKLITLTPTSECTKSVK